MGKRLNKNVPELRFPEFDGDWKEYKLSQLFSISAGGDIHVNKVNAKPDDVYKYPVYANAEKNKGLYGYSNEYKIEPNVITIAGRGVNIGIAHARDHRFYPIVRLLVLKPKTGLNIYFFEYQINRMNVFVESTGVPQLTVPQVSSYKIFSTLIAEQEKIASFLGAVDTRLNQLRRKRELLQTYKRGVMQKLFSQEIRFKGAIGSEFPDWEKKTLGEVLDFKNGINADKSKYGSGKKFINVLDIINENPIYHDTILGSVEITEQEFDNNDVKYGDILFQRSSEIREESGQSNVYLDKNKRSTFGGFVIRGRPKMSFNPIYFHYLLKTSFIRKEITDRSGGSTRFNIGQNSLSQVPLFICSSIEEQERIANFLTAIDRKIKAITRQIEGCDRFKQGLLQKMFV